MSCAHKFATAKDSFKFAVNPNYEVTCVSKKLADAVHQFRKRHPKVWKAFNELGERCHEAGPLDEKSRRLVKLAMSIGAGLEGATHSALRSARKAGVTAGEIDR